LRSHKKNGSGASKMKKQRDHRPPRGTRMKWLQKKKRHSEAGSQVGRRSSLIEMAANKGLFLQKKGLWSKEASQRNGPRVVFLD